MPHYCMFPKALENVFFCIVAAQNTAQLIVDSEVESSHIKDLKHDELTKALYKQGQDQQSRKTKIMQMPTQRSM